MAGLLSISGKVVRRVVQEAAKNVGSHHRNVSLQHRHSPPPNNNNNNNNNNAADDVDN